MARTLYRGMPSPNNDVKTLQYNLKKLGYMTQAQIDTGPGWFGPRTEAAVRNFQKKYGLGVDGIAGPKTLGKIAELLAPAPEPSPPVNKNPSPSGTASPPAPPDPAPKEPSYPSFPAVQYSPPPSRAPKSINTNLSAHGKACIVNLTTNTTIYLPFSPEDVTDSVSVSTDDESILGRSAPYVGYNNTSNRSVSFSVKLHSDYCSSGLEATINALKALEYPLYYSFTVPPKCYLNLANGIRCTAICSSVDVTYSGPMRYNSYLMAEVAMKFDSVDDVPFSSEVVEVTGNNT